MPMEEGFSLGSPEDEGEEEEITLEEFIKLNLGTAADFKKFDKDGGGTISQSEYLENATIDLDDYLENNMGTEEEFKKMDTGGLGKITRKEYLLNMEMDLDDFLDQDIGTEADFKACDVDGSGKVSMKEFEAFQKDDSKRGNFKEMMRRKSVAVFNTVAKSTWKKRVFMKCEIVDMDMKRTNLKLDIINITKRTLRSHGNIKVKKDIDIFDVPYDKIAATIKKDIEQNCGLTWNVFAGYGGFCHSLVFEEACFIHFKFQKHNFLVFKSYEKHGHVNENEKGRHDKKTAMADHKDLK